MRDSLDSGILKVMDLSTITSIVIGGAIGGAVTWLVAWIYYRRAGVELLRETTELRRLSTLVLDALEAGHLVTLTRDSAGRIIGITIRGSGSVTVTPIVHAIGHVTPPPSGRQ
jgi:YD repeat-containing protein